MERDTSELEKINTDNDNRPKQAVNTKDNSNFKPGSFYGGKRKLVLSDALNLDENNINTSVIAQSEGISNSDTKSRRPMRETRKKTSVNTIDIDKEYDLDSDNYTFTSESDSGEEFLPSPSIKK